MSNLSPQLLRDLIAIVGREAVLADDASLDTFARTTLPKGTRPAVVVRPDSREQIQQIFQKASAAHCPVFPISRGRNWGYGDACAPKDNNLILDLSRMNRIVEVNTKLAYAVIEPGVTQGQLAEYLEKNNFPLILDGNGAGPDASLIGNIAERGFGHSRYGDRFAHVCNFEAVLADGRFVQTGFGAFPKAQAQHVYTWGIGPYWDGLLTQSNFAVITRATIWLMVRPEHVNYVFIGLKDPDAIGSLVDRFRPLYLSGTLRSVIHCANDLRLLGSAMRFPWTEADGRESLDIANPALLQTMYRQSGVRAWSLAGILTGSRGEVAAFRKTLKRALRGMPGIETAFFMGPRLHSCFQGINVMLKRFDVLPRLQRGLERVD
jgi:4-cresol dehydrogenase (hydroxylating)